MSRASRIRAKYWDPDGEVYGIPTYWWKGARRGWRLAGSCGRWGCARVGTSRWHRCCGCGDGRTPWPTCTRSQPPSRSGSYGRAARGGGQGPGRPAHLPDVWAGRRLLHPDLSRGVHRLPLRSHSRHSGQSDGGRHEGGCGLGRDRRSVGAGGSAAGLGCGDRLAVRRLRDVRTAFRRAGRRTPRPTGIGGPRWPTCRRHCGSDRIDGDSHPWRSTAPEGGGRRRPDPNPTAADKLDARAAMLARAGRGDYWRWLAHVQTAAACTRPVRLAGTVHTVNTRTGELVESRPDGRHARRRDLQGRGNRRAAVCPACAEVYRADAYQLVLAGLRGGKGIPDTVAGHPAVFATLTAPRFGLVHSQRRRNPDAGARPCRPRRTPRALPARPRTSPAAGLTATMTRRWASRCASTATTTPARSSGTPPRPSCGAAPPSPSTGV